MAKTRPPTSVNKYVSDNGSKGDLRLWLALRASKSPPLDRCYALGVDVSVGTGASNSCISVFDCRLREKVGELASPRLDPTELAEISAQIGRWFEDWTGTPAVIIWEANGIGRSFGKRLLELNYENLYYSVANMTDEERKSRAPGMWATGRSQQVLIRDYGVALLRGSFVEPSEDGLKECYDYRYFPGGGDRVRANALALHAAAGKAEVTG
jgi:hypothetical protein